jgi:hypothetical protein
MNLAVSVVALRFMVPSQAGPGASDGAPKTRLLAAGSDFRLSTMFVSPSGSNYSGYLKRHPLLHFFLMTEIYLLLLYRKFKRAAVAAP